MRVCVGACGVCDGEKLKEGWGRALSLPLSFLLTSIKRQKGLKKNEKAKEGRNEGTPVTTTIL